MKKILLASAALAFSASLAWAGGHGGAHWGYHGDSGPAHWGDLSEKFAACKEGKNQSPVNLTDFVEAELAPVTMHYQPTSVEVLNNGHSIQVNYAPGSSLTVNGHTYTLKQFHFHSPSENQIDGKEYPLEAHLVHADADGNLAVVAVLYEEGAENPTIAKVWNHMPMQAGKTEAGNGTVNAADLLPANHDYYRFNGSLTTPPCSEGVLWIVMKDHPSVSAAQAEKLQHAMHGHNNRPVQPLNARVVLQ